MGMIDLMINITNGDIFRSYDLHQRVSPHSKRRQYRDTQLYLTSLIYWLEWE